MHDMQLEMVQKMAGITPELEQNQQLLFNIAENVVSPEGQSVFYGDLSENGHLQVYETVEIKTEEPEQVYETIGIKTEEPGQVYESNGNTTKEHGQGYETNEIKTEQPVQVYETSGIKTEQPGQVYETNAIKTEQPGQVYETNAIKIEEAEQDSLLATYKGKKSNLLQVKNDILDHFSDTIFLNGHKVDKTQFNCPICNLNFSKPSNVRMHIKIIHEGKKHDCPFCNKKFSYAGDLRRHIDSIHEGKKT